MIGAAASAVGIRNPELETVPPAGEDLAGEDL
jgi:hypothetical protein